MAQIDIADFKKAAQSRNQIHQPVKTTYFFFRRDGEEYFQLNTFGSPHREFGKIPSQKIQLDRKAAKALVEILQKGFGL